MVVPSHDNRCGDGFLLTGAGQVMGTVTELQWFLWGENHSNGLSQRPVGPQMPQMRVC